MKHFYLRVHALSPLAIRADHAEGGAKTSLYIPGTTLLGSLAAAHRMVYDGQDAQFADFFLADQVYFPHLYPASFTKSKTDIHTSMMPVMPLPKTAQSCKRFSGFLPVRGEENAEKRHGIRDSLFDWGVFSLLEQPENTPSSLQALLQPLHAHRDCTHTTQVNNQKVSCTQVMEHASGFYRRSRSVMQEHMQAKAGNTRLQTRTGVNRDWGVVEEGMLYNREVFEEDTFFWGEVLLQDGLEEAFYESFKTFVEDASVEESIYIGTGRTRGLGHIKIELRDEERVTDIRSRQIDLFTERLNRFNTTFRQQAQVAGVKVLDPFYFAVTFHSPGILCDSYLRYQQALDTRMLEKEVGLVVGSCKHIYQASDTQCIRGWNELWGTPRSNDYAIEMGSTFLFAYMGQPDSSFFNALRDLEERGMGRRRAEGFGRVSISDPFHLEGEQA